FEGETSPTSQLPGWRSLFVAEISSLKLRVGPWSEGRTHMQTQPHIQIVDVDVNIPETLTRQQPLPFGSPHLLPPRGRKAAYSFSFLRRCPSIRSRSALRRMKPAASRWS